MSKGEVIPYDTAMKIALRHMVAIGMMSSTEKIAIVGSLRRKKSQVRDIDLQIIGKAHEVAMYFGEKMWTYESGGDKRQIFKAPSGLYLNCFYTTIESWGASLMHNTGSSKYNIRKRMMVKRQGGQLNQYGLYMPYEADEEDASVYLDSACHVAGRTEKGIYDYLGWEYCKPEDRE